jgi:hypothetical protein
MYIQKTAANITRRIPITINAVPATPGKGNKSGGVIGGKSGPKFLRKNIAEDRKIIAALSAIIAGKNGK